MVRQFAIGTGIHIVDECGNRASEIASVKIIEGAVQKLTISTFLVPVWGLGHRI